VKTKLSIIFSAVTLAFGVLSSVGAAESAALASKPITCPVPPPEWAGAPVGAQLFSQTPPRPKLFGPTQQPGQHQLYVECDYFSRVTTGNPSYPKFQASIIGEYALPSDPNPVADFNFGCGVQAQASWNPAERTYFVSSPKRRAYVQFTDTNHMIPDKDIGRFEQVAKSLLGTIAPRAHSCHAATSSPLVVRHLYLFGFEFILSKGHIQAIGGVSADQPNAPLIPAGRFVTVIGENGTVLGKVVSVKAPVMYVHIIAGRKKYGARVRISGGIDFLTRPPIERLRLRLKVVSSNYPGCRTGSKGLVTITRSQYQNSPASPARLRMSLCEKTFAGGNATGTALIKSG
jgi:hypothetical protein